MGGVEVERLWDVLGAELKLNGLERAGRETEEESEVLRE
jgi:hypothetical protein